VLAQKPWIVPIPGTTKLERLEENIRAGSLRLTHEELHELDRVLTKIPVVGDQYPAEVQRMTNRYLSAEVTFVRAVQSIHTEEQAMKIARVGSVASTKGPADWFTGNVRIDSLFPADDGRHSTGGAVTFEPGARTRWHTQAAGQTMIITQSLGWVQRNGGPVEEVRPGDVIFFEVGETVAMKVSGGVQGAIRYAWNQ